MLQAFAAQGHLHIRHVASARRISAVGDRADSLGGLCIFAGAAGVP